jgi:SAM-dependent methyltransferase
MRVSNYVYDQAWEHERDRLAGIEAWLDPGTKRLVEQLGIREGWRVLEAGGGGGSIASWLAGRVGSGGHVVATDLDTRFLDPLAGPDLEVRRHDVVNDDLEQGAYDLIHARLLLEHLPARREILKKFGVALAPGGVVLIEDMDFAFLIHTPASRMPLWPARGRNLMRKINRAFGVFMTKAGYDSDFARNLPEELTIAGFAEVGADSRSFLVRGGAPESAFARFTLEQLAPTMVSTGALTQNEIDRAIRNVTDPASYWMSFPIVGAWGRRPA